MKISDIQRGRAILVEVHQVSNETLPSEITLLQEVKLIAAGHEPEVLLRIGENVWEVEGVDEDLQVFRKLVDRDLPRVAWVAAKLPKREGTRVNSLVLEVREFPQEVTWQRTISIGVDEKIVEDIRVKRKSLASTKEVIEWLTDHIIISDIGEANRVLMSARLESRVEQQTGFRLYGKGWAVDVAQNRDGCLVVKRIVEARIGQKDDNQTSLTLVHSQFRFLDHTIAGQFEDVARNELDEIVSKAGSYLAIWRNYNVIEQKNIRRRAQEFGWMPFHERRQLPEGQWRFSLSPGEKFENAMRFLEDNETVDLEAAIRIPDELNSPETELSSNAEAPSKKGRIYAGECVGYSRKRGSVDLILPEWVGQSADPPPNKGFLFMSMGGDRSRLERRQKAQALIVSAECPMPQLGLLIEGKPVPHRRSKKESALSAAAKEVFGGEPTGRQIEALRVALNTPDIALIQGPPGTGKTRTIAALQVRLAEISEKTQGVSGRYLLSSYQHDAVENVASATKVYGLPAVKIGRKRGQQEELDGVERWRQDRVEAVRARLAEFGDVPASTALRKCTELAVGYLQAPSRADDIGLLLSTVRSLADSYIPPALSDKILELQNKMSRLSTRDATAAPEVELALKAVRGLRTDAASFSDDGDMQAEKAFLRLQRLSVEIPEDDQALLKKALEWDIEKAPDFLPDLADLQARFIDLLMKNSATASMPLVNNDVEQILGNVIDAMREHVRSSASGVDAVLADYCNDLETDQWAVRDTVREYTAVLAATCQQAVGYHMNLRKEEGSVFETVVVDEAARANPLDLFIPMSLAERRIILVGDHRQLPHILDQDIESDLDKDVQEKTKEVLKTSLFQRLFEQLREKEREDGVKRTVTLNMQYRMHPALGQFISDTFYAPYGEGFDSGRNASEFSHNVKEYKAACAAWVDFPLIRGGETRGKSKSRKSEARWIAGEAHRIMNEHPELSVGVITFYSAQVNEIQSQMEKLGVTEQLDDGNYVVREEWKTTRNTSGKLVERFRVGTVDAFQGKEFDVVLLSMTRSNDFDVDDPRKQRKKYGHLMLENRLCVAMSRQQRLLIVVGDVGMLKGEEAARVIPGLVKYYEFCGGEHGIQLHA